MVRTRLFILAGIVAVSSLAVAQVVTQGAETAVDPSDISRPDAIAILSAEPERLVVEFQRLGDQALAPQASSTARRAFVSFLHTELIPYLSAAIVLYPLADSVGGTGGYAVASALFDGEAITRLVKELDGIAGSQDAVAFRIRAFALSELLDLYFTKQRVLVAPVLARLSEAEVSDIVERIAAERTAFQKS